MTESLHKFCDRYGLDIAQFDKLFANLKLNKPYQVDWLMQFHHPTVQRALEEDITALRMIRDDYRRADAQGDFIAAHQNWKAEVEAMKDEENPLWGLL